MICDLCPLGSWYLLQSQVPLPKGINGWLGGLSVIFIIIAVTRDIQCIGFLEDGSTDYLLFG